MNGIVVVDKSGGITSHDVVNRLRRLFGTKRVGHAGTLDPLATGVLVAGVGQATRILQYLAASRKRYLAGVRFGLTTDSQDITGREIERRETSNLQRAKVEAALSQFTGCIFQIPPMYSAIHHDGHRLYELARKGEVVERAPRQIEVYSLKLVEFKPGPQAQATLDIECSSGTYIRTLVSDIGDTVETGAAMESLRRTCVGPFDISQSQTVQDLTELKENGGLTGSLVKIPEALSDWSTIQLTENQVSMVRMGKKLADLEPAVNGRALLVDDQGRAVGLSNVQDGTIAPFKVFAEDE